MNIPKILSSKKDVKKSTCSNTCSNKGDTMNKKISFLLLSILLFTTKAYSAQAYYGYNPTQEPEEPEHVSSFCGGYVGANFNFGSLHFLSQSSVSTEIDSSLLVEDSNFQSAMLSESKNSGLRESLNTIGGGITFGWSWTNSCWYLATELNGFFYSNFGSTFSCDPCYPNNNNNQFVSEKRNSSKSIMQGNDSNDTLTILNSPKQTYSHSYQSNIRLDGIVKLGFLVSPSTALYVLGGGSGLPIKYGESVLVDPNGSVIFSGEESSFRTLSLCTDNITDPSNSLCCTKWTGGGTVGFGIKALWCDCFEFSTEVRYARYVSICLSNNKRNNSGSSNLAPKDSENETEEIFGEFAERDNIKFRTDSFLGLIGVNWHF